MLYIHHPYAFMAFCWIKHWDNFTLLTHTHTYGMQNICRNWIAMVFVTRILNDASSSTNMPTHKFRYLQDPTGTPDYTHIYDDLEAIFLNLSLRMVPYGILLTMPLHGSIISRALTPVLNSYNPFWQTPTFKPGHPPSKRLSVGLANSGGQQSKNTVENAWNQALNNLRKSSETSDSRAM
jgi:hypothetical protein